METILIDTSGIGGQSGTQFTGCVYSGKLLAMWPLQPTTLIDRTAHPGCSGSSRRSAAHPTPGSTGHTLNISLSCDNTTPQGILIRETRSYHGQEWHLPKHQTAHLDVRGGDGGAGGVGEDGEHGGHGRRGRDARRHHEAEVRSLSCVL